MTSSRRSSTPRGGKRPRALEAIAAGRDSDPGRPVIGAPPEEPDPFAGEVPEWPPAEAAGTVPEVPPDVGVYRPELEAIRYLVGYSLAMALPMARIEVGSVAVTFAPPSRPPGVVTAIGGGTAADLYEQFGGDLYRQLQERLRAAADIPR